jgi:transposase InsO family protein
MRRDDLSPCLARRTLFGDIEGWRNSRRLHSAIGYNPAADMERVAA